MLSPRLDVGPQCLGRNRLDSCLARRVRVKGWANRRDYNAWHDPQIHRNGVLPKCRLIVRYLRYIRGFFLILVNRVPNIVNEVTWPSEPRVNCTNSMGISPARPVKNVS